MINADEFRRKGIKPEDEKSPLDIIVDSALTTQEIADQLTSFLPPGSKKISYSCAKQKMVRLENKGLVERRKVDGIIRWLKIEGNKNNETN